MRLFQLLETTQLPDEDPFQPHSPTDKEATGAEKRNIAATKHLDIWHKKHVTSLMTYLEKLKANRTRGINPADVITYQGDRYLFLTADPVIRDKIKKAVKGHQTARSLRSNAGGFSLSQTGDLAEERKARWPAGDAVIVAALEADAKLPEAYRTGISHINRYIKSAVHERWPEIEPYLLKILTLAVTYAVHARKTKWPQFEQLLLSLLNKPTHLNDTYDIRHYAVLYAVHVLKGPWPELEPFLYAAGTYTTSATSLYAKVSGKWPAFENQIANVPIGDALAYAKIHFHGIGWPALQEQLRKRGTAPEKVKYATDVIQRRWGPAETTIIAQVKMHVDLHLFVRYSERFDVKDWAPDVLTSFYQSNAIEAMVAYALTVQKQRVPEMEKAVESYVKKTYNSSTYTFSFHPSRDFKLYASRYMPGKTWPALGI